MEMTERLPGILQGLLDIFDEQALSPCFEVVDAEAVPAPYRALLVHENHMTVAMEGYHRGPVDVQVLAERHDDACYARRSLLTLRSAGRVVQHCTVRIHLRECSEAVRREIVAGRTPLGTLLVNHDVMRRIEPAAYLRIDGATEIMKVFGRLGETVGYGRAATIHTNGRPTIELLEIVAPE